MSALDNSVTEATALRFIKDSPADADEFGTHTRIANAVAAVIQTHSDLKVIGLVGKWGSGKSTVISLIEQALKQDTKITTKVFIYDAWLHQSDPPRRSFLETLVAFLGLHEDKHWKNRLAELNGQIDDTDTKTTPTLTTAGRFILLSLFLLPLGLNFSSAPWLGKTLNVFGLEITVFWIGIGLLVLPFLIAAAIYVAWRPTLNPFASEYKFWKPSNWLRHKSKYEDESILTLFMSKATTRVNHRVSKSPDPTTIEFQRTFRELVEAVSSPTRRYIFVVDNLDRLPEAAAVDLWATIRSFFLGAEDHSTGSKKLKLPTVLLPIDPDAVKRMYAASDPAEAPRLAQAFMDKTFDLTFSVPPPVFSDWKKYIETKMRFAFASECLDDWIYQVSALYEKYLGQKGVDPSPRQINTLVNSCAVLWLQWKGEIPFQTLAYYAINKSAIEDNLGRFIREAHPEIARFDENWAAGVAAIYFGVPVSIALQVHLEGLVTQSISTANAEKFMEQARTPGFDRVFESVIDQSQQTREFVTQAGYLLGELNPPSAPWVSSCWRTLVLALGSGANEWTTVNESNIAGLRHILQKAALPALAAVLNKLSITALSFDGEFWKSPDSVKNWTGVAICTLDTTSERGQPLEAIPFSGGAEQYLQVLEALSNRRELIARINPSSSDVQIIDALAAELQRPAEASSFATKFDVLLEKSGKPDWTNAIVAAANLIRSGSGAAPIVAEAVSLLGALRMRQVPLATQQLTTLVTEGFLFEKFAQAKEANAIEGMARLLALTVLLDPTFAAAASQGRASAGIAMANALGSDTSFVAQVASSFDTTITKFHTGSTQLALVNAAEANAALQPLVKLVLSNRVKVGKQGSIQLKDILSRMPVYLKYIEPDQHIRFVSQFASYKNYDGFLRQAEFNESLRIFLRLQLQSDESNVVRSAREEIAYRLKALSEPEWKAAVSSGNEPFVIAGELHALEPSSDLGSNFYDALKELADGHLDGDTPEMVGRWYKAITYLNSNNQATQMRGLRDRLLNKELENSSFVIVQVGGTTLLDVGHFDETPDRALRYLVLPLLDLPEGIQWLGTITSRIHLWISKAPHETGGSVEGRIDAAWEKAIGEDKSNLAALSVDLGFGPLPKPPLKSGEALGESPTDSN